MLLAIRSSLTAGFFAVALFAASAIAAPIGVVHDVKEPWQGATTPRRVAPADPWAKTPMHAAPPTDVVDPWKKPAKRATSDVVDPWRGKKSPPRPDRPEIVPPWPVAKMPPIAAPRDVVDPWR